MKGLLSLFLITIHAWIATAQSVTPDLSKVGDQGIWSIHNREAKFNSDGSYVHVGAKQGDGVIWLKNYTFSDGTIEVDVKGKDDQGKSFVGVAFYGVDKDTYDAVYFRPFNFKNPERRNFAVQYISHPKYTWQKLRSDSPEKYEHAVKPVPEPVDGWFHVAIKVSYPEVLVYVNNEKEPTMSIQQLSTVKKGFIGLWVGNNSEGDFKNLKIIATK